MPAHDLSYKWSAAADKAVNDSLGLEMSLIELQALTVSEDFASAVVSSPDELIHPQDQHP